MQEEIKDCSHIYDGDADAIIVEPEFKIKNGSVVHQCHQMDAMDEEQFKQNMSHHYQAQTFDMEEFDEEEIDSEYGDENSDDESELERDMGH